MSGAEKEKSNSKDARLPVASQVARPPFLVARWGEGGAGIHCAKWLSRKQKDMKQSVKGVSESEEPSLHRKIQAEGQQGQRGGDFKPARVVRAETDGNQQEGRSEKSRRKGIRQDVGATLKTLTITEWVGSHWSIETVPRILH